MGKLITNQILGMKWLNTLIGNLFGTLGLDATGRIGGSIQLFLYDMTKVTMLLCMPIYLISYVQNYFPPERSKKTMGRFHGIRVNCVAALPDMITPFCSCSSIPLFIRSTSTGLPPGVASSSLILSPMVDLGSLIPLMNIFRAKVAILCMVLGLAIIATSGTLVEELHMKNQVEEFARRASAVDIASLALTQKERLIYARDQMAEIFKEAFPYALIGVGTEAVIHNWISENWVMAILGNHSSFGVILTTIVGIPVYVDILGMIPIAEALPGKGIQLGTVPAFMMGVITLSLPSMIILRKIIKLRLLGVFITICAAGIIIVSYLSNPLRGIILQFRGAIMSIFEFGEKEEGQKQPYCCGNNYALEAVQAAEAEEKESGIKVLDGGCAECSTLEVETEEALRELDMDAAVDHVRDFEEVTAYRVMTIPALVVDDQVVSYGKVLKEDEVVSILEKVGV